MNRWALGVWLLFSSLRAAAGEDASWVTPEVDAPQVVRRTFHSAAAGQDVSYHLYVPEAYGRDPDRRWPVLYWLHGTGGGTSGIAALSADFDRAIRTGLAPPMLIVFPNGLATSMWCDSKDGIVPMETIVVRELLADVDANYRTRADRGGRMIEGFSMGGYGAARLGLGHPDLFGAASVLAGGPLDLAFGGPRASARPEERERILREVYGGDIAYFRTQSPIEIASRNADVLRGKVRIRIAVGERDSTAPLNRAFSDHLRELGIEHAFVAVPGVGHRTLPLLEAMGDGRWDFYRKAFGE